MRSTGVYEAKQNFSALIESVEAGEEVRITRHGKEVVRMLPVVPADAKGRTDSARSDADDALDALRRLRARVKPGPGWRELRDDGRKR